jgi:hypothetical protein
MNGICGPGCSWVAGSGSTASPAVVLTALGVALVAVIAVAALTVVMTLTARRRHSSR